MRWNPADAVASARPEFTLRLSRAIVDLQYQWHTGCGCDRSLKADWSRAVSSKISSGCPLTCFFNDAGRNRLTVALDDCVTNIDRRMGVREEDATLSIEITIPLDATGKLDAYSVTLWLDESDCRYEDAVRAVNEWWEERYAPMPVPEAARLPMYSCWYSFHQGVYAAEVEAECARAKALGMDTVIVDDGWQTDDNSRGYAYCGDWQATPAKIPDMRAHVKAVHELGMKYMLWYSVPFVGKHSENFARFKGKYLSHSERLGASTLDPRFPEVRRFLVELYATALTEWGLDGLKLDFIDSFRFDGPDPAAAENYAGRDIKSLPMAVDRLMTEVVARCRELRPDVLLEFRQSYVGPAIRRYGNMMRVGDCAYGVAQNRTGSLDLRLSSGPVAVHSDMLAWNLDAPPETAALQLLNVLFAVPQISMRMDDLPPAHRKMLKGWLDFWTAHRETLMFGELRPLRPDLNYPIVYAFGKGEQVVAVYDAGQTVHVDSARGTAYVVNATGADRLTVARDGRIETMAVAPSSALKLDSLP